jgi:hypothetical protein
MKKNFFVLSLAVLVLTACQQTIKPIPVNLEAEKAAVDSVFVKFNAAYNTGDVATMASFLSEDLIFLGTDPGEAMTKQQTVDLWKQLFADTLIKIELIGERRVKVAPDGNSAVSVDQFYFSMFTPQIPWRNQYHLVKTNNKWMIIFGSSNLIPKNEDIPKLNKALE